jgi:hypothetical protein
MVDLMHLGSFSVVFIIIIGFVSNQNPTALAGIQDQIDKLSCPMPSQSGLWNNTGTLMYSNGTYNYANKDSQVLTLTCTEVHTLDGVDYYYGQFIDIFGAGAGIPMGAFFFIGDYIAVIGDKLLAVFTLIGFYLTPINFEILGYTIDDLALLAQMAIISIYGFCYIMIGIMIYKILSPFSGAS